MSVLGGPVGSGFDFGYGQVIGIYRMSSRFSKIKPIKDTMNFIVLIFKIGLYFAPMKIFFPIDLAR